MPHKIIFWGKKGKKEREKKEKKSLYFKILSSSVSFLLLFLPGCMFTHFGEVFPILQLERTVQILLSALKSIKDAQTGHACFSWAKSHIKPMGVLSWIEQAEFTHRKKQKRSSKKCSYLGPYRVNFKAGQLQRLQNHDHSRYETAIYILNESLWYFIKVIRTKQQDGQEKQWFEPSNRSYSSSNTFDTYSSITSLLAF